MNFRHFLGAASYFFAISFLCSAISNASDEYYSAKTEEDSDISNRHTSQLSDYSELDSKRVMRMSTKNGVSRKVHNLVRQSFRHKERQDKKVAIKDAKTGERIQGVTSYSIKPGAHFEPVPVRFGESNQDPLEWISWLSIEDSKNLEKIKIGLVLKGLVNALDDREFLTANDISDECVQGSINCISGKNRTNETFMSLKEVFRAVNGEKSMITAIEAFTTQIEGYILDNIYACCAALHPEKTEAELRLTCKNEIVTWQKNMESPKGRQSIDNQSSIFYPDNIMELVDSGIILLLQQIESILNPK